MNDHTPPAPIVASATPQRWFASVDDQLKRVAHEVRNPLNGATLQLALIRRLAQANGLANIVKAADVATKELRRTSELIAALLDSSLQTTTHGPIAHGRQLDPHPITLAKFCQSALCQNSSKDSPDHGQASYTLPNGDDEVTIDSLLILEALALMIRNGRTRIPNGTMQLAACSDADDLTLDLVFTRPQRDNAFATSAPVSPGLELDLAFADALISHHHGQLACESSAEELRHRILIPLTLPENPRRTP